MRATRYYQLSVILPFAIPTVLVGPLVVLEALTGIRHGRLLPGVVDLTLDILGGSVVLAGLPYALFAICALLVLRGRNAVAYRRFAVAAPLLFSAFFFLWNIIGATFEGTLKLYEPLELLSGVAIFVIPLGYLYVGLCFLGHRVLSRRGVISA